MKKRLSELDSLRGIAAFMVVLCHFTGDYINKFNLDFTFPFSFYFGKHGVQLFFLISGFVIFLTLNKTRHPLEFVVSRVSRLYPVYWASAILTFLMIYFFGLPDTFSTPTATDLVVNLTMLQRWFSMFGIIAIDPVYWTLAVELSFYVIIFMVYITGQLKRIELLSFVYLLFIIAVECIENYFNFTVLNVIKVSLLLDFGNLFIAGIMFYKLMHESKIIHYLIIALCLSIELYLHEASFIYVGPLFLVFYAFTQGWIKFIAIKPLIYLGKISYSLYLTHQIIGYIFINYLYTHGVSSPEILLVTVLFFAIGLASLLHYFVEKPSQSWIRNYWHNSHKFNKINDSNPAKHGFIH